MGSNIRLTAEDGHQLGAYAAKSTGPALAAVVVVQEIFGVNRHVRSVADDYASQGFWAIAPALFDRVEPNLELDYNPTDASQGMQIANQLGMENALKDVDAASSYAGSWLRGKKVGVVGYCFGGTLAWPSAEMLACGRSNWAEDAHESHPETTGKRHTDRMPREQRGADRSRVREVGARDGDCPQAGQGVGQS